MQTRTSIDEDDALGSYTTFRVREHEAADGAASFLEDTTSGDFEVQRTAADMASWAGQPAIKGSSESMRMMLLTVSHIGIQCV